MSLRAAALDFFAAKQSLYQVEIAHLYCNKRSAAQVSG